jgi:glycosyltransferase involved in cell wall biosynthesis
VDQFPDAAVQSDSVPEVARLAYVGRVSEQKNLHTLLVSLWVMRTFHDEAPPITLDVFGGEDGLGSPNMGIKFTDYAGYLVRLTDSLGLDDIVTFHGFTARESLFREVHACRYILVSPTLHSDENFGSSVLASLVNGHHVVTTAWGGHLAFKERFHAQVGLVPVHRSTLGPVVQPVLLVNAIREAITSSTGYILDYPALSRARAAYSVAAVTASTLEMLDRPLGEVVRLDKSRLQIDIDQRRFHYGGARRMFRGYADTNARAFFEAYGMNEPLRFVKASSYLLAPWVSISSDLVKVLDPHRGDQTISLDGGMSDTLEVLSCPSQDRAELPEELVRTLVGQGYAFPLPMPADCSRSAGGGDS